MRRDPAGVALLLAALACAGGGSRATGGASVAGAAFPSPSELEELAEAPPPAADLEVEVRDVERWTLAGPFPEAVGAAAFDDASPFGRLLADAARERAGLVVPTEAMHCFAREIGRYRLEHHADPDHAFQRYARARCGASVASVSIGHLEGSAPEGIDDARLLEHWRAAAEQMIREQLVGGPRTAGIWLGRAGERAVAVLAVGRRELRIDELRTALAPGERVAIRGEVLEPTQALAALVNRGRFGVAVCEADPEVALPRFHFECEPDPGDEHAWLTLSRTPPGRLLSTSALEVLIWPRGAPTRIYERPVYAPPLPMASAEALDGQIAELVNRLRAEAGAAPLAFEREQSATAGALAPHFFASLFGNDPQTNADLVLLGLLAGWDVDGLIQDAHFSAAWAPQSTDLSRLLSEALESPVGRRTLLSPEVERIAVGSVVAGEGGDSSLGALFVTYALFSEREHEQHARRVRERLAAKRAERGLGAPRHLHDVAPLAMRAASAVQAGAEPEDALQELLEASGEALGRSVHGWIVESSDLDRIEFPEEFVARPDLELAVGVSVRRPQGEPWGRYVVMIVAASPPQQRA
jgi:hypothetical protein